MRLQATAATGDEETGCRVASLAAPPANVLSLKAIPAATLGVSRTLAIGNKDK